MIAAKNLVNVPPYILIMLLQLHHYDLTIKHWFGKDILLANVLRKGLARSTQEIKPDLPVDYTTFNKAWIKTLRDITHNDPILGTVYQIAHQGWLHQWRIYLYIGRRYWNFRDKFSTDDSFSLNVILQKQYLDHLHEVHMKNFEGSREY